MNEPKQLVKDAALTTQDAWKLIARRKRLTLEQRRALIAKLEVARQFIDEALERLGTDGLPDGAGR